MPVNYGNGKIYKIWSPSHPELVYYGSTIQALSRRMAEHRSAINKCAYVSSSLVLKYDDAKIELVEDYPCERKELLLAREGYFIRENVCVNKQIPGRTRDEYGKHYINTIKGKEVVNKYLKQYVENKKKIHILCECGGRYTILSKYKHMQSDKHFLYLKNLK